MLTFKRLCGRWMMRIDEMCCGGGTVTVAVIQRLIALFKVNNSLRCVCGSGIKFVCRGEANEQAKKE